MVTRKQTTVLAVGADIKNRFLIATKGKLYFGPALNDLSRGEVYEQFQETVRGALKSLKVKPSILAHDLHPLYFSTASALKWGKEFGSKLVGVQHHHAHIAGVQQEHALKEKVIGVSFDGTGFGTDGNIWGGEFFLAQGRRYRRLAHLRYLKMPGGEKVVREPWRMALSVLGEKGVPFLKKVSAQDKKFILSMLAKDVNVPLTSSAGRIFDAAAALLGLCEVASVEAEGPIKLEALCEPGIEGGYDFAVQKTDGMDTIDVGPLFLGILADLKKKKTFPLIATKFHNSMAEIILSTVKRISRREGVSDVILSGGVFQNKFLMGKTILALNSAGFRVFTNEKTSVNDLNISLGQYYVSCGSGKN